MTDRIHSLTVALDKDMRDDDVQPLIDAIQMLRHVAGVTSHVADINSHMAEMRANTQWLERLSAMIRQAPQ